MDEHLQRQLEALTPAQRELFLKLRQEQNHPETPLSAGALPSSYDLSFAQQRFWLLEQLHPGEPAHHLSGLLLLSGPLDRNALRQAIDQVLARHATLRTSFAAAGDQPKATPQASTTFDLQCEDLRALHSEPRNQAIDAHVTACTTAAFDLETSPLMRARLLQIADEQWQLVWCVHHIAADGLSMLRMVSDLGQFYAGLVNGQPAANEQASHGYHDFAQWTATRDQNGEFAHGLTFFEQQLRDLPTTRLRPDHGDNSSHARGARLQQPVDGEVSAALLQLSKDQACTPFVTMLTAFVAALHRWTGDDDLVLGTPFANRNRPGLQNVVGLFVNSLVLRCRPSASMTFLELLGHVREVVRATFAHGDVPFERLVQQLAPERNLDRNPLFQVMFNFVDFADVNARVGPMQWRYQEAPAGTLFDFTLYVRKHDTAFVLEAEYDCSLFAEQTIALRLQELHTLLQAATHDAGATLGDLPLLPHNEQQLLARWEQGAPLADGPNDAYAVVAEGVRAAPHAAVADADGTLTGSELLQIVTRIHAGLRAHGVQRGDRVAFEVPRSRWLPALALAIWRAGAVAVPIDPAAPDARRQAVRAAAQPVCCIVAGRADDVGNLPLQELLDTPTPATLCEPTPLAATDPAYLLYTSGSTGQPKGVVVPHASLAAFLRAMRQTLPLTADDTLLAITSPSFDIAWLEWLLPLCVGGKVHVATEASVRDGAVLARQLREVDATYLQATPSTYRLLLAAGWRGHEALHLLCGGEALHDDLAQQLRSRCKQLWNVYGPTETTIWSTIHEVSAGAVRIGHPIPGTSVHVVDAHGRRVAIGCPGELWVGGHGLALGYDRLEEITATRFGSGPDGERIYRTGDRVRFDQNGQLEFLGRVDQQVKVRGHRIEPGAVEAWLAEHEQVAECAVLSTDQPDGTELIAHVVIKQDDAVGEHTDSWRDVWQAAYEGDQTPTPRLDHRGWLDSRTGEPIPTQVMRRFVQHTCDRIAALGPKRVLEVGCGTGMLVAQLAGTCETWLATDPTPAAVTAVEALQQHPDLAHVTARQLRGDQLSQFAATDPDTGPFDCVVINSVAQYFPSLDYLLTVLAAARNLLAPGGTIFLGDVRLLPLHGAFVAWRELAACAPATSRETFAARCDAGTQNEPELLVHPSLFDELVERGVFADRWIAAKAGDADTEMDRFRADIVLTTDSKFDKPSAWPTAATSRTAAASHAFALRHDPTITTVADLRTRANHAAQTAKPPPAAADLTRKHEPHTPAPMPATATLQRFANAPLQPDNGLLRDLRTHLARHLPAAIVPSRIHWHATLPRLPSGKVDRKQLLQSVGQRAINAYAVPTNETEQHLIALFGEVLAQTHIGRNDDFFALGGHSLAAARLLARIRETMSVDLGLRQVFATPTVHQLAHTIATQLHTQTRPLQPRSTSAPMVPGPTMERLWFLQRLNPGSRAYLMMGVADFVGSLRLDIFEQALRDVVARHEILNLRLEPHDGKAVLRAAPRTTVLRDLVDEATFEHTLDTMTGDELRPLQVLHVALSPTARRFAFVLHHAFADGWSLQVLRRDLATAYTARLQGGPPDWTPLTLQYLDFVHWQAGANTEEARAFWLNELDGADTVLQLPTRQPHPAHLQEQGERLPVTLDAHLVKQATTFAQQHGATTYLVMLAVYQLWLARLSGQRDLIVGTTVANRDHPELEHTIGCFLQTLPLRAQLDDDDTFVDLLAQVKATFLRCTEHQSLPFQELLDAVAPPRLLNRTPLLQATLDWLNVPSSPPELPGLEVHECQRATHTSKFELSLVVTGSQPFAGYLEYRSDLFDAATVRAWWRSLTTLLTQAMATPELPVRQLGWLAATDQRRLLSLGTGAKQLWPHPDVISAWRAQVAATPDHLAIQSHHQSITYRDAQQRALTWAARLQQHNPQRGDRVAICLPRGTEQLLAMLAILQEGCAYVVVDPSLPPARAHRMLVQADVAIAICADRDAPPFGPNGPDNLRWCASTDAAAAPLTAPPAPTPTSLAYVLFTSGSTGEPKGVAVSHRALANYAFWARDHYERPRSAAVHTQLGFDLTLTSIWPVLLAGGAITIASQSSDTGVEPLLEVAEHGPFALAKLTPSHLAAWQASKGTQRLATGLVLGGEALHLEQLAQQRADGVRLWNEYGPTEATVGCACHEITSVDPDNGPAAIGTPIANTRLYVLDEQLRLVPPGVIGELWIAGDGLADGYFDRDDLTQQRFINDPFVPADSVQARMYRSGDFVCWNHQGELRFVGRRDEQVKLRGHRLELGEVRAAILAHPDVAAATALVRTAPSGSEQLLAYVVGMGDDLASAVRSSIASTLPSYAVPAHILTIASLPMDRHGKLDTEQLASPWTQSAPDSPPLAHAASSTAREILLRLASDLLHVPDLSDTENFFAAGGDSILALQLVARAADIGLTLEIQDVFAEPTMSGLAGLAQRDATVINAPDSGPLLPMQQWFFAQNFAQPQQYDQAIWLAVHTRLDRDTLADALATIVARHPALRTRYVSTDSGMQQQVLAAAGAPPGWHPTTLDVRADDELTQARRLHALTSRSDFDPASGNCFAATLVCIDEHTNWLYLRAHHLAVDAVSWRLLGTELSQLLAGAALPPPAASPIAHALHHAAAAANGVSSQIAAGTCIHSPDAGTEGNATAASIVIDGDDYAHLLAARTGGHRVQPLELLLAAAVGAVPNPEGRTTCLIDVEGHGRDNDYAPGAARTVAWFTSMRRLALPARAATATRLRVTKEQVRTRQQIISPAAAPLLVNFLGAIYQEPETTEQPLSVLHRDPGQLRHPDNHRTHAFELRAADHDGELRVTCIGPDAASTELFVATCHRELRRLLRTCAEEAPEPSYVDFPRATLPAEQIAGLLGNRPGIAEVYPLTPTQQGMLFAALEQPDAPIYREQVAVVIAGPLQPAAMAAAFTHVANRHELLRGEVHWRGLQQPHWLIPTESKATVTQLQLPCVGAQDEARVIESRLEHLRQQPFTFGPQPLMRIELAQLADDRCALLVTYHHVVLDGWSMPLLLGELVACYREACGESVAPLPDPRPFGQHVDFLATLDLDATRTFWRARLAGFTEPVTLMGDLERGSVAPRGHRHDECEHTLTAEMTATLRNQRHVTMSTLVQAAWAVLLSRWSGQSDVLFGVTVAGRPTELEGVERRIGLFINTLPLRVQVDEDTSPTELLRSVQATVLAILTHQHTPLPLSQAQTDVPAGTEPFGSLLVFENYPLADALRDLPDGLSVASTVSFERTSYPLTLVVIPGEQLCLRLLYQTDRYSSPFAEQLLALLATLLEQLATTATPHLQQVPWLPDSQIRDLTKLATGPAAVPHDLVCSRVLAAASAHPNATAIVGWRDGEQYSITYAQLEQRAAIIAADLQHRGATADCLIAYHGPRDGNAIATLLGIWWSGAAYLPVDPEWPEQKVQDILAACQPTVVIDADYEPQLGSDRPPLPTQSDSLAYAIATSGTTGTPKIVLLEHASLANYVAAAIEEFALTTDDRVLQFASLAFDTAAEEIWPTLCAGATLVMRTEAQATSSAAFVRESREQNITVWDLPTAFFHQVAAHDHELPDTLRLCIIGGQAAELHAVDAFVARATTVRLCNSYGPSEATIVATWCPLHGGDNIVPIGTPVPGTVAWVCDRHQRPQPLGMPGELCLAGAGLARGYIDSAATAERFVTMRHGKRIFRTGDQVRRNRDGRLEFLGRFDRQLKVSGVRIEPEAIEAMLQQHSEVTEALVLLHTADNAPPRLVAFAETHNPKLSPEALRQFLRTRLAKAAVPQQVITLPELPRLVSGKVDANALSVPAQPTPQSGNESPDVLALQHIFAGLFGHEVDSDDDFFDLGGSSLVAVQLADAVHNHFGIELSIEVLFADPSPAGIAAAVRSPLHTAATVWAQMHEDAELPADYTTSTRSAPKQRRPAHVLLTGATGFFGRYVLQELLRDATTRVTCVLRAEDDTAARHRLDEVLTHTHTPNNDRVQAVCGDVGTAQFGLTAEQQERLDDVTVVVHVAAAVDFLRPYTQLREANVIGTRNVLQFCAKQDLPLHHVSSVGVFSDARTAALTEIDETTDLQDFDQPIGGYAQSKWVAEQLVRHAMARGLKATIHRPGRLVADTERGRSNEHDFVTAMLRLCRDVQRIPQLPYATLRVDVTPVDHAARELAQLTRTEASLGGTFHLVHSSPPTVAELLTHLRAAGWTLRATAWPEFCSTAVQFLSDHPEHPAVGLLPFLRAAKSLPAGAEPRFGNAQTAAVLAKNAPTCPPIDARLVQLWVQNLTD